MLYSCFAHFTHFLLILFWCYLFCSFLAHLLNSYSFDSLAPTPGSGSGLWLRGSFITHFAHFTHFIPILLISFSFYSDVIYFAHFLPILIIYYSFCYSSFTDVLYSCFAHFLLILLISCSFYSFLAHFTHFLFILVKFHWHVILKFSSFYSCSAHFTHFLLILLISCSFCSFYTHCTHQLCLAPSSGSDLWLRDSVCSFHTHFTYFFLILL